MAKKAPAKPAPAPKKAAKPAPKKKTSADRSGYIAKAPIRRLMKFEGAELVAEDAVVMLIGELEKAGKDVTEKAVKLVKADKRKRVTAADIVSVQ